MNPKFKIRVIIEVAPHPESKDVVTIVDWGDLGEIRSLQSGYISIEVLKRLFSPANCEALDLVDPERVERVSRISV